MEFKEPGQGRSHGALLARLLWPTGLLFAVTSALVIVTFLWTTRDADHVAEALDHGRLSFALNREIDALGRSLDGVEPGAGLLDGVVAMGPGGAVRTVPPLAGGTLPADFDLVRPVIPALLDELRPASAAGLRREVQPDAIAGRLVAAPSGPLVVVVRSSPDGGSLAGWRRLAEGDLLRLAGMAGLRDLRLAETGRILEEVYAAPDTAGRVQSALTWSREPVGSIVQARLAPLVVVALSALVLLFGAVTAYYFWTTRHLAAAEAASKAMLGRDPLSGLPNRMLFNERLDRELRLLPDLGVGLAVMFIDLDRFKDVNDTYGHQAGDELIKLVAQRLSGELPETDTLARFGGDEFAIIQLNVRDVSEVSDLAGRILEALGRPFELAHSQVTIGTSIGVALAPEQATDRHNLLKLADTALYQAKNGGRNRTSFFQRHMDEAIRMRKVVEDDLRSAIEADGLALYYQPIVSADGETVVGVEALVRWPHPTRGMISPAEFIPIAEECGLVIPLEEWVLRRACRDGERWPGLQVAVNVSPIQFRHRQYVETVTRVLRETGFDPSRLELELTEGVVVADADAAEASMIELQALGVNLALDDFGTGYSSLIYLRRFAFDKIKIDRSFLESMEATGESAILVHSIVHLGRALGLVVTAEGVETKEQHRFLHALGCHQLQGFLFSAPVPAAEIDRMLAAPSGHLVSAA